MGYLIAGFLGVLTGVSEIVSRYRDEPANALASLPGLCYIVGNSIVSLFALYLLTYFAQLPDAPLVVPKDPLVRSIFAGLGAMLVLRSKLITLKSPSGADIALGPDAVVSTLMSAVDRAVDRARSRSRLLLVGKQIKKLTSYNDDPEVWASIGPFFRSSLASFQNLTADDRKKISDELIKLEKAGTEPDSISAVQLRVRLMAYGMLNVGGEENFNQLMSDLLEYLPQKREPALAKPASSG